MITTNDKGVWADIIRRERGRRYGHGAPLLVSIVGYNYRITDIQLPSGWPQLERRRVFVETNKREVDTVSDEVMRSLRS